MGVSEIWVADPASGSFDRFANGELVRRERFVLPERRIELDAAEICKRDGDHRGPTSPSARCGASGTHPHPGIPAWKFLVSNRS